MLRTLDARQRRILIEHPNFSHLNRATACYECNATKGAMHPLDWLRRMRHDAQATRLAERLIAMGEDMGEVFHALREQRLELSYRNIYQGLRSAEYDS